MIIYSLDVLLFLFGTNLLFHVVLNILKYTDLTAQWIFFQISPISKQKTLLSSQIFPTCPSQSNCSSQRSLPGGKFHLYNTKIGTKISEMCRPFVLSITPEWITVTQQLKYLLNRYSVSTVAVTSLDTWGRSVYRINTISAPHGCYRLLGVD